MIANTLLCIPDLTGFTKFIRDSDIVFCGKVVPRVLKALVNSNVSDFMVGEIEGDAVFFYKFAPFPELKDIHHQCMLFFKNFKKVLEEIELDYPEEYKKYLKENELGLKIVLHCGTAVAEKIHERTKLIGEDVIKAHKLLKNSIKDDQYILCSQDFLAQFSKEEISEIFDHPLVKGKDKYEHIGKIKYKYYPIS